MTGRLVIDDLAGVDQLLYSSHRDDRAWDRFWVAFVDGGHLRLHDPRRLGGVELDPDEGRLGPHALAIGPAALKAALASSDVALKAPLMAQRRVARLDHLIADDI